LAIEGAERALQLSRQSTTERDALTPLPGMVIFNETTNELNYADNSNEWLSVGAEVSQASMWGSVTIAADAAHIVTGTATSYTTYSDTDIIAGDRTNVGNAEDPSTVGDVAIKGSNVPPGEYMVVFSGSVEAADTNNNASNTECEFRLYDGTNVGTLIFARSGDNDGVSDFASVNAIIGRFRYTSTQSSVEWALQYDLTQGESCKFLGSKPTNITVYRFPLDTDLTVSPSQQSVIASGAHDTNCTWTTTSSTVEDPSGDATCDFAQDVNSNLTLTSVADGTGNQPQIQFTPAVTGNFEVCATSTHQLAAFANGTTYLTDGSDNVLNSSNTQVTSETTFTLCGILNVASASQQTVKLRTKVSTGTLYLNNAGNTGVYWTVKNISQSTPMPQIINTVESSASGGVRTCSAKIENSGTPAVSTEEGNCIDSLTDITAGDTIIDFTTAFSVAPRCTCSVVHSLEDHICTVTGTSTTSTRVRTYDVGGSALADATFNVICIGDK